ncbi:hypothetical protein [Gynuella sp.]|uniref:hypothetical protein n=1 Tax=Gynuella sp. TaxID=2969146 RepID=UPI003D0B1BFE
MSSWYQRSMSFIRQQKAEHPEMPHAELRKHCSKHYPFSERRGYAYKAFLHAMRDVFGQQRKAKGNQHELL